MATTRVGLVGPAAAYLGFSAKDSADTPQAAYVADFFVASYTPLYFKVVT